MALHQGTRPKAAARRVPTFFNSTDCFSFLFSFYMKQTNNAIKFLMAQYRAIFKNAYFKGLTTAMILTAGLAAAQGAQAADSIDNDNWSTISDDVTVDGNGSDDTDGTPFENLTVSGSKDNTETSLSITITGGTNAITVATQGTATKVTGTNATITLGSDSASGTLSITGSSGANASLAIKGFTVTSGTLTLEGGSETEFGSLTAETIVLGAATADDASIKFSGAAANNSITGQLTNGDKATNTGKLDFTEDSGSIQAYTGETGVNVDIAIDSGNAAVLNLTSENKLFKVNSGSIAIGGTEDGTFTVQAGTLELGGAEAVATIASGNLKNKIPR